MSVNRLTQIEPRPNDPGRAMPAAGNTPWIGVYMLSQTLFCRRAGLLTLELGQADDGEEFSDVQPDTPQKLSWMEEYDDAMIAEALARHWNEVLTVSSYLGAWLSLCLAIYFSYSPSLGTCMALSLLVFVPWSLRELRAILELDYRRREAAASRSLLDLSDLGREERIVNWWQLRKAGFSVSKPQESHRDEQMRLQGKPFLILQYSGLKIPVVRKHHGKHELHSQNRARVAAYCHLLEVAEQVQAPFGVFMFAGSYEVVIVPNDPRSRSLFERGLEQSRELVLAKERGFLPQAPEGSQCSGCGFGYPRIHEPGVSDGHLVILQGAYTPRYDADKRERHSVCGDRFEWLPRHDKSDELGL